MSAHDANRHDNSISEERERLKDVLARLAARYRGSHDQSGHQADIIREYHATLHRLDALGWDGIISPDCELPMPLMPEGYQHQDSSWAMPKQEHPWEKFRTRFTGWIGKLRG